MDSDSEAKSPDVHPIFVKDPVEFMQYVYKEVRVEAKDGTTHTGHIYSIDPVSESVALVKFSDSQMCGLELIMGHAVEAITVIDEDTDKYKDQLDALFKVDMNPQGISPEEMKKRKERLRLWMLKNRLPVEISPRDPQLLTLSDALFIEPPYGADNCRSTNEIILGRVQGLIKNMPKDVEDW